MHMMMRRPMRFHSKDLTFRTRWHRRFPDFSNLDNGRLYVAYRTDAFQDRE